MLERRDTKRRTNNYRITLHEPGEFDAENVALDRDFEQFRGGLARLRLEEEIAQPLARRNLRA